MCTGFDGGNGTAYPILVSSQQTMRRYGYERRFVIRIDGKTATKVASLIHFRNFFIFL